MLYAFNFFAGHFNKLRFVLKQDNELLYYIYIGNFIWAEIIATFENLITYLANKIIN